MIMIICICLYIYIYTYMIYPLAFKHSNGKSLINGVFNGKIIYKMGIFHCNCHV